MSQFTTEQLNEVVRNDEGQVIINPEIFKAQVEIGWKADKFTSHYEITASDLKKILKALGLQIRKFHKPKFVISGLTDIPTVETTEVEEVEEEVVEEKPKATKPKAKKEVKEEVKEEVADEPEEEVTEEVNEEELYQESVSDDDFGGNGFDTEEEDDDEWV